MATDKEFLQKKTEEGKRNSDFRDVMESILYEIHDQTQAGQYSTTYKLKGADVEFSDPIIQNLTDGENPCDVEFDEGTGVLSISWSPA
ncbi:hypothetical protein [Pseudomonas syringae]|uniref:hypothetical protein n=1 Tax=Pseudomonas syringae TaxID=317 RepID=UPI00073F9704|nr:hypothetical protein [Pseudomonas syringae]NAT60117.1 hypothetical protein [Pseudomonas syringae pv. actinidifoliorum]